MSMVTSPYQLLEINIISAQDLTPVSKSTKAYAVAWLHPKRKLTTQIDQVGHTNPTWNEKFVFRVDDNFLNSDNSVIMIEIYASAWLRDVLVGTVGVLVSNLIPPSSRSTSRKPKLRFVALQIRRPSGRPQGILNIGVTLLDSTMRSMPLYSELSASAIGYRDLMESNDNAKQSKTMDEFNHEEENSCLDSKLLTLPRCQSEKNDSTINDYTYNGAARHRNGNFFDGEDSEVGVKKGAIFNEESLCSDVGPSPSVVAAAIAKGLYPITPRPPRTAESSMVDGWSESSSMEGMKNKIEKWRTELTPAYEEFDVGSDRTKLKQTPRRTNNRRGGLFSCMAFGCVFSISCGGGNRKKRHGNRQTRFTSVSEITYDQSSYV